MRFWTRGRGALEIRRARTDVERHQLEHRYVDIRLLGWTLIGLWQVLSLASEFVPLDLESRAMRITGKAMGLMGLVLVAWGFERLFALKHPDHRSWRRIRPR